MKIPLDINIVGIDFRIKLYKFNNIVGFVEIFLIDNRDEPIYTIRGSTIKWKSFNGKESLHLDFPAYKLSNSTYNKSFCCNMAMHFDHIENKILDEYYKITGTKNPRDTCSEDVNPDDIPI